MHFGNGMRDIISPCGLFKNPFPLTVSLLLPLPFPLPILGRVPIPLPIRCSHFVLGPFLTSLHVLFPLIIVIAIAKARTAPSSRLALRDAASSHHHHPSR